MRIVVALVAVAALVVAALTLPLHEWMLGFIEWVRGAGLRGALLFGAVYVLATVLMVPGSLLTLGAGFVYGPLWGVALVSPASVTGATVAFLLARTVARSAIEQKVSGNARFSEVDRAVGRQGFKIVALLRLSPIFPFTFLNYALGLTRVRPASYVLASFLGMLPGTFLYVYLGSLVPSVADLAAGAPEDGSGLQTAFLWGGFAATLLVTVYITRLARRALGRAVPMPAAAVAVDHEPGPELEVAR